MARLLTTSGSAAREALPADMPAREEHAASDQRPLSRSTSSSSFETVKAELMDEAGSSISWSGNEDSPEAWRSSSSSTSAPPLRSSIDTRLQALSSVDEAIVRRERRAGGRAEPPRRALNLGVSRLHGGSIGKKPSGRRLDRNDPHGRARQADLAAARYSVTTWEDIQRFRVQAAATKARHEAWEAKPIAWDLVLAGSFSAMAAA